MCVLCVLFYSVQALLGDRDAGDEADTRGTLKVLREAEVLHTRMQECNLDKLLMEESASGVEDVYQLSDNRISCLLAEVQFLTEADAVQVRMQPPTVQTPLSLPPSLSHTQKPLSFCERS